MPDNGANNHDKGKPKRRRSRHAEQRAQEGRRVPKAINDAQRARKADVFFEIEKRRYVVRGSKGREHIFTRDGQLITTIDHRPHKAHVERLRSGKIRPVTDEEYNEFRNTI